MIKNKKMMSGFVVHLVEQDLDELSTTANGLLEQAADLREKRRLLDSYRLYQEVEKEFLRLEAFSKEASKHRKELFRALRRMGITPR